MKDETNPVDKTFVGKAVWTIFLCFLAALLEGADIVSMGLAAPSVARAYGFAAGQVGLILTSAVVGLMAGAAYGGWLGDRIGRKKVLIGAFAVLAMFSLATTFAHDLNSFLLTRLLCGVGLGAAFPNLIAITVEASPPGRRATGVSLMFCGQPLGATALGVFIASHAGALDWRVIFYIGGFGPLLLIPLLIVALPESTLFKRAAAAVEGEAHPRVATVLFGQGRGSATLLLWVSFAFTQVVVYVINNWLPTLMVAKGFTGREAAAISALENLGAAVGCVVLARLADGTSARTVLAFAYALIAAALCGLAAASGFGPVAAAGVILGFFAIGGQLVLYTVAPAYYPVLIRATGVGAAVAVGRFGAIAGPLTAGGLLAAGVAPAGILLAAVPGVVVAGAAAAALLLRKPAGVDA